MVAAFTRGKHRRGEVIGDRTQRSDLAHNGSVVDAPETIDARLTLKATLLEHGNSAVGGILACSAPRRGVRKLGKAKRLDAESSVAADEVSGEITREHRCVRTGEIDVGVCWSGASRPM